MKCLKKYYVFVLCLICCLLTGCISINKPVTKKLYLFNIPTLSTPHTKNNAQNIILHPVTISAAFSQNYFLYRINANQYLTDYYHSFLISPARQLDPIIINYLKKAGFYPITTQDNITSETELSIQITELYADYRNRQYPKAVAALNFVLTTQKNNKKIIFLDKTFRSSILLKAKNTESLIDAWSKGLQSSIYAAVLKFKKI